MVSFAGFYATPETCAEWVRARCPRKIVWNAATAERLIGKELDEKNVGHLFGVRMVPVPQDEPYELGYGVGIMVWRLRRKEDCGYVPPREESPIDLNGQQMLQDLIGLTTSEWRTLCYDPDSVEHGCRFVLPPSPSNGESS